MCSSSPDEDVLLLAHGLPQRLPQRNLGEVLQRGVDGVADRLVEHGLHAAHQHLQHGAARDAVECVWSAQTRTREASERSVSPSFNSFDNDGHIDVHLWPK